MPEYTRLDNGIHVVRNQVLKPVGFRNVDISRFHCLGDADGQSRGQVWVS